MKRIFDFLVSFVILTLLLPLLVILYFIIKFKIGSPVLFMQNRPGFKGEIFKMYKFRTMSNCVDPKSGELLPDSQRLSSFGVKLRNSSLDELPGLWSVLKGDMSLVGPRPLLVEYLPLYSIEQKKRHNVKPGITGWAQVNGRNAITWEEKFKLDVWYVNNQSFILDFKILLLTVKKVIIKDGISGEGEVTMSKFTGTQSNDELSL